MCPQVLGTYITIKGLVFQCRLKYVHVELALCFLVTNFVYPNKIDRLTYHSIAKVAPVLSEKSL